MSEPPALAHCHAEGYPTDGPLAADLRALAALFDDEPERWTRGEDDDPVEFGMLVDSDEVAFLDEEVFEHVAQLHEAAETLDKSIEYLSERDLIDEGYVDVHVELDAGLRTDEVVHMEDQR
jgi:hypothetical protein